MRAALTHPASKFSKTSFRLDVFVCYVLLVKRIIFKTNLVFWIFLIVVYGFIYSHECEQIQDTKYQAFYQRGKEWNFQRGKRCSVLMVNAGKRGVKIKKMEAMPTCYCPTFVLPALSSHFSVLSKFRMYHEYPFAFSPAMSVMPSSQKRILRWPYLRLDQSAYHGSLSMMTSSEGPLFSLASGPPNLKPTTALKNMHI